MLSSILLLSAVLCIAARPTPSGNNIKYDQRQEGEWNVRADLENFVVLIIPSSSGGAGSLGLLDLLRKVPRKKLVKHVKKDHAEDPNMEQHFIESKAAPYQVDISKSRNNLAKLHPQVDDGDDLFVARSPSISLLKNREIPVLHPHKHGRLSKAYVVTIPVEDISVSSVKKEKSAEEVLGKAATENLHLLGDGLEECGPGLKRDEKGVCKLIVN